MKNKKQYKKRDQLKTITDTVTYLRNFNELDEVKWLKFRRKYLFLSALIPVSSVILSLYLYSKWGSLLISLSVLFVSIPLLIWQVRDLRKKIRYMSLSEFINGNVTSIENKLGIRGMREVHVTYSYKFEGREYGPFKKRFMYPHGYVESDFKGIKVICDPMNPEKHGAFSLDQKYNWNEFNLRKESKYE